MKHFNKIALLLMAVVFLAVLPSGNALKVSAAEPTTHLIVFNDTEWICYVGGSTIEESQPAEHRETYYLEQNFKDGDILVIQGAASYDKRLDLDLGGHSISNLTVTQGSCGIVLKAGSIDECHLLGNSSTSITGYITDAYVYDAAEATFCSDVDTLHVVGTDVQVHARVSCQGTVNHVIARDDTWVIYEYWNVEKNKLNIDYDGSWQTEEGCYSTTPAAAINTNPRAAAANNANNPYDKVPKTGSNNIIWLFVITAVCCAGGLVVLKKSGY